MKIFVSWSGDASHDVARALKNWIPNVFQAIDSSDVFLSSEDIEKGVPWFSRLGAVLDESNFGILCLTPENLRAPWILYEAGAMAKHLEQARVVPMLIGLTSKDLEAPLSHLNAADTTEADVRRVVESINRQLGPDELSVSKLDKTFEKWWPDLQRQLRSSAEKLAARSSGFARDVFLSAPMAAFADDDAFKAARADVKKVFDTLRDDCKLRVYWAGENIHGIADFDAIDVSVDDDLRAIRESRYFVLLYPKQLPTSALFEAGYALALRRMSHYFVTDRNVLPFLMRELHTPLVRIHTRSDWKGYDDLVRKLKKYKDQWFAD